MAAEPVSPETVRSATWDEACAAYYLLDRPDLSVVQELLPPGTSTRTHAHDRSRQFFHVLRGEATMTVGPRTHTLPAGSGIEVGPRVRHRVRNNGEEDLEVLVISSPRVSGNPHARRARSQQRDRSKLVVGSYVRRTRPRDLEAVAEVEDANDTRQWVGEGGIDWHKQVLQDADMEHWVLVDHLDRVCAFGILAGLSEPGAVELRRMIVAPEGRRQGLGRLLLRHLLEQALARPQVTRVWLDVGADNVRARNLYRSFGFVHKEAPPGAILLENGMYMEWSAERH
ncbi:GNAT family N-acetyltransferase [Ornithinimicrobium avium]|uniref:GNAT family N-acetyltransferase n=1 Tax=Ornithinimicrobium avium TaxID=2283195 RepID=A0A345NIQ2_9MICO|nr:GNAT family N-acetyltransferase [Ornithinimicrobium avium]AXH94910.1 GNAT family N-acetyltransferase [Ornithinimicrobium avium]